MKQTDRRLPFVAQMDFTNSISCLLVYANTSATFQCLTDLVLSGLQLSHCLVYLDDVIILGASFDDHLCKLAAVFECL